MTTMTHRQNLIAALRRQEPERVPFEIGHGSFTPALFDRFVIETGSQDPGEYFGYPVRPVSLRSSSQFDLWRVYARYYEPCLPVGTTISEFGTANVPGSEQHFTNNVSPLAGATTVEEFVDYPLPDGNDPARSAHLPAQVDALHKRGLAAKGELSQDIFETAWYIRGLENMMMDFKLNPDFIEVLFDRLTELRVVQAGIMLAAGVDLLRLGDDVSGQNGMLISPATWRKWHKPRLAKIIDSAKAVNPNIIIGYHTDGNCRAIIPELIEIGVEALNPIQPECMNPVALKEQYGDRLSFWGTIGTQTTFPFGTVQEVRQVVKERISTIGRGGGLLIAPTHVLEPDVPWENVIAFFDAIHEFGGY